MGVNWQHSAFLNVLKRCVCVCGGGGVFKRIIHKCNEEPFIICHKKATTNVSIVVESEQANEKDRLSLLPHLRFHGQTKSAVCQLPFLFFDRGWMGIKLHLRFNLTQRQDSRKRSAPRQVAAEVELNSHPPSVKKQKRKLDDRGICHPRAAYMYYVDTANVNQCARVPYEGQEYRPVYVGYFSG